MSRAALTTRRAMSALSPEAGSKTKNLERFDRFAL
jgi:hypothetical protein